MSCSAAGGELKGLGAAVTPCSMAVRSCHCLGHELPASSTAADPMHAHARWQLFPRPWQAPPAALPGETCSRGEHHMHAQQRLEVYLGSSNSTNAKAGGRGGVFRSMERTRPYCRHT